MRLAPITEKPAPVPAEHPSAVAMVDKALYYIRSKGIGIQPHRYKLLSIAAQCQEQFLQFGI